MTKVEVSSLIKSVGYYDHYSPNNQVYVRNLAGAHLLNKGRVMNKHYFTKCLNIPPEDKSYTAERTAECTKFLGIIAHQEMTEL
jgi:hypothetical protein